MKNRIRNLVVKPVRLGIPLDPTISNSPAIKREQSHLNSPNLPASRKSLDDSMSSVSSLDSDTNQINVWDNSELNLRGINAEDFTDFYGKKLSFMQLFKLRSGFYEKKRVPDMNEIYKGADKITRFCQKKLTFEEFQEEDAFTKSSIIDIDLNSNRNYIRFSDHFISFANADVAKCRSEKYCRYSGTQRGSYFPTNQQPRSQGKISSNTGFSPTIRKLSQRTRMSNDNILQPALKERPEVFLEGATAPVQDDYEKQSQILTASASVFTSRRPRAPFQLTLNKAYEPPPLPNQLKANVQRSDGEYLPTRNLQKQTSFSRGSPQEQDSPSNTKRNPFSQSQPIIPLGISPQLGRPDLRLKLLSTYRDSNNTSFHDALDGNGPTLASSSSSNNFQQLQQNEQQQHQSSNSSVWNESQTQRFHSKQSSVHFISPVDSPQIKRSAKFKTSTFASTKIDFNKKKVSEPIEDLHDILHTPATRSRQESLVSLPSIVSAQNSPKATIHQMLEGYAQHESKFKPRMLPQKGVFSSQSSASLTTLAQSNTRR